MGTWVVGKPMRLVILFGAREGEQLLSKLAQYEFKVPRKPNIARIKEIP